MYKSLSSIYIQGNANTNWQKALEYENKNIERNMYRNSLSLLEVWHTTKRILLNIQKYI